MLRYGLGVVVAVAFLGCGGKSASSGASSASGTSTASSTTAGASTSGSSSTATATGSTGSTGAASTTGSGSTSSSTGASASSSSTGSGSTGASCGASNFTTHCGGANGYNCPANGTCVSGGCGCADGYVDMDCSGVACSSEGGCSYPNWWCEPRQAGACGAPNFALACPDGQGGTFYCPANGVCGSNNSCGCASGYSAQSCAGSACNGNCSYPDWWCAPDNTAPVCGAANFTHLCPDGHGGDFTCPEHGTCGPNGTCGCELGYVNQNCSGQDCSAAGGCSYPNWWCTPAGPPTGSTVTLSGACTTCDLANGTGCSGGQTCIAVRPGSSQGICAAGCDSNQACADPQSTCVDDGSAAVCYPWACLGQGQPAPSSGVAHEPWPQVPFLGQPAVSTLQPVLISWDAWDGGAYPYQSDLEGWAQRVMATSYLSAVASEYGVQGSSYAGAVHLQSTPSAVLYDTDVRSQLTTLLNNATLPAPTAGSIYVVLVPASTVFHRDALGNETLCGDLVGYHDSMSYQSNQVLYAVIGQCGAADYFGLNELQSIETAVAHELVEAATDPVNDTSWSYPVPLATDDPWAKQGGEVADMCEWEVATVGSSQDVVTRSFSNASAAAGGDPCLPALAQPSAAVSSLPYTALVPAGGTVTVPLTAWSTDAARTYVALGYLATPLKLQPPSSLPVNQLVAVQITAPSSAGVNPVTFLAAGADAGYTLWPVCVESR